jgi:FixJ family two-component response regulator
MSRVAVACTVYVVDADESVRAGLVRLVSASGLKPKPCDALGEFLAQAPGGRRACAVVDVSDLLRWGPASWSRLREVAAGIPVIALSASDDPATRHMARELGAQAFFRKPVDAAALLDSIHWIMQAEARDTSA